MSLVPVTSKAEIARAYTAMVRSLKAGAERYRRTVGWKGDDADLTLHWHPKHQFWVAFSTGDSGGWCPFGTSDPHRITSAASITCEINPPKQGINRRKGGVFLKDAAENIYVAHTGKVAGGRKGIGKNAFFAGYTGKIHNIEWPDGASSQAIVLGRIGSTSFLRNIGNFVHAVEDFKSNITAGAPAKLNRKNPELSFTPEFEGKRKSYRVSDVIESECSHGTVVKSLHDELESKGYRAYSTPQIDLFMAGRGGFATHVFEVKTDQTTTSLYGAVGQVMLHTALQQRTPHRILVLPGKPTPDTLERLAGLGIRVVTYEWDGDEPRFQNLSAVL